MKQKKTIVFTKTIVRSGFTGLPLVPTAQFSANVSSLNPTAVPLFDDRRQI